MRLRGAALVSGVALALAGLTALATVLAWRGLAGPWAGIAAVSAMAMTLAGLLARRTAGQLEEAHRGATERIEAMTAERDEMQRQLLRHGRLEQQLLQAKQAAEAAVMAKGEFLATMSHEIRTPLNGIIPMLEMIARGQLTVEQREMLQTASDSSRQLLRIVDDILDYSKLEANRLELEITTFNLRELLDGVQLLMQRSAEHKGLHMSLQLDPAVRLSVRGDPVRLRQVLGNLLVNAIKFTERGEIQLVVRRLGESSTQHQLRFEVRDTGIGIDEAQQARLFNSFTQADASTTRLYGGTGLGLAICKRIIDLMGGRIGVESTLGKGSTFWFEIPLLKVIGDLRLPADGQLGSRALMVSPERRLTQRLDLLLANWGVSLHAVDTVQEALERLRSGTSPGAPPPFEVVIADLEPLRQSVHALHRALARTPAYLGVRAVWLYGDDPVPEELRSHGSLLPRQAGDAELRHLVAPLPVAHPEPTTHDLFFDHPVPEPAATPAPEEAGTAPLAGVRVLLVEDNPVNLLVAQKLLGMLGCEVDAAGNGEIALQQLEAERYSLVLMDCQMPVLDGYAATGRLREREAARGLPRTPVIAMTANAMAGDRQRCLDAGMDDYLSKPVSRDQLEARLLHWSQISASAKAAALPSTLPPPVPVPAAAQGQGDSDGAETAAMANQGSSGLPVLDTSVLDELREVIGTETARIVGVFLDDTPGVIRQLQEASLHEDMGQLRELAHSLKSAAANVGAMALSATARRVELGARAGTLERPAVAVALVIAEFARARLALSGYQNAIRNEAGVDG